MIVIPSIGIVTELFQDLLLLNRIIGQQYFVGTLVGNSTHSSLEYCYKTKNVILYPEIKKFFSNK